MVEWHVGSPSAGGVGVEQIGVIDAVRVVVAVVVVLAVGGVQMVVVDCVVGSGAAAAGFGSTETSSRTVWCGRSFGFGSDGVVALLRSGPHGEVGLLSPAASLVVGGGGDVHWGWKSFRTA